MGLIHPESIEGEKDTMNGRKMMEICTTVLEPWLKSDGIQENVHRIGMDGWKGHNKTKARLREVGWTVWDWPANSCDFNPIEQVFGEIKYAWSKKCPLNRTPTKAEVILGHQTAWEEYTLEEYWKHLEQMPLRMEACIRAKGFRFYKELRQLKREKILEKK
jgi:hypothetical protein